MESGGAGLGSNSSAASTLQKSTISCNISNMRKLGFTDFQTPQNWLKRTWLQLAFSTHFFYVWKLDETLPSSV